MLDGCGAWRPGAPHELALQRGAAGRAVHPCGLERVGGQDFGGIRVPVPSTKDLEQLVELNRHLIALEQPHAQLQQAVDALTLLE